MSEGESLGTGRIIDSAKHRVDCRKACHLLTVSAACISLSNTDGDGVDALDKIRGT